MTLRCGYIALIGRPNVGKSTLLNTLIKKKLSITSRKPQTTRHQILGIKSTAHTQFIFVDTPGIHAPKQKLLNQYLNRTAFSVLHKVDMILWLIEASGLQTEDQMILEKLALLEKTEKNQTPIIICINKTDMFKNQSVLLKLIETLSTKINYSEIVPISAKTRENIPKLERLIEQYLPENDFFFDTKSITDRPNAFVATEMIREQVVRSLGQELPYATMVKIDVFKTINNILHISAVIFVERNGQKKIVIGEQGQMLKLIGQKARLEMEKYFEQKIFLKLWVKVKAGWSDNESLLRDALQ